MIFVEALVGSTKDMRASGEKINNICWSNDTVLIADSIPGLQKLLTQVKTSCEHLDMKMNTKKKKVMKIFER